MADVFRTYEKEFFAQWGHVLGAHQRKAFAAIRDCRTAALGGHVEYVEQCDACGHRVISYNSCRNRHCPKCQAMARAEWLNERDGELLPVPYFHIVFTLPQKIGALALQNAREIYRILFRAASETLLTIAADNFVVVLFGEAFDGGEFVDARVVHQDVEVAEVLDGCVNDALSLGGFGDISTDGDGVATGARDV